jgi:hypothetical protein
MDYFICHNGKKFLYIPAPSPIQQDNGKIYPYLNIQRLLTIKDEKNVRFIYLPLKINTQAFEAHRLV